MNDERFFDCILLNEINKNPNISFDKLSASLKCSKTIIIDRIELLLREESLILTQEGFILTKRGHFKKVTTTPYEKIFSEGKHSQNDIKSPFFRWDIDYIPDESSFE